MDLPSWLSGPVLPIFGVVMAVVTVVGVVVVLIRLPPDHFLKPRKRDEKLGPVRVARNILGVLLILAGIAMLVLPGQGVLAIVAGLLVTDIKGKRKMALKLLKRPAVQRAVAWLRETAHRPPLELPERPGEGIAA